MSSTPVFVRWAQPRLPDMPFQLGMGGGSRGPLPRSRSRSALVLPYMCTRLYLPCLHYCLPLFPVMFILLTENIVNLVSCIFCVYPPRLSYRSLFGHSVCCIPVFYDINIVCCSLCGMSFPPFFPNFPYFVCSC